MHALYAIYLPSGAAANLSTSGTKAKPRGIMLQDAIAIRKKCFKTGNNVKLVNRALSRSIPFHELFCAAEDSLDLRALESRIIEKIRSSSDENRKSRITNQIDLQTRRERDQTERHYRRGEGQFISNTPRILIDLDK